MTPSAIASRLGLSDDHGPLRGTLGHQALDVLIGGIYLTEAGDLEQNHNRSAARFA